MKTPTEIIGGALAIGTLFAMLVKCAEYVLRSFHNEHVAPSLAQVTDTVKSNTTATLALTEALADTNTRQQAGFERLGEIVADHEKHLGIHATRLDNHDHEIESLRRPPAASRTARQRKP